MSSKKQGQLTTDGDWAKHLRPFGRRRFWSKERMAEPTDIRQRLGDLGADDIGEYLHDQNMRTDGTARSSTYVCEIYEKLLDHVGDNPAMRNLIAQRLGWPLQKIDDIFDGPFNTAFQKLTLIELGQLIVASGHKGPIFRYEDWGDW